MNDLQKLYNEHQETAKRLGVQLECVSAVMAKICSAAEQTGVTIVTGEVPRDVVVNASSAEHAIRTFTEEQMRDEYLKLLKAFISRAQDAICSPSPSADAIEQAKHVGMKMHAMLDVAKGLGVNIIPAAQSLL